MLPSSEGYCILFTSQSVLYILDHLKCTAQGWDQIPAWILSLKAPIYTSLWLISSTCRSHLRMYPRSGKLHLSTRSYQPHHELQTTLSSPYYFQDDRAGGGRAYLYPELNTPSISDDLKDKYAFRPTGTTTAAVFVILHRVTTMLRTNHFVVIISTDYSKAFDTIRQSTLAEKLSKLNLHDSVYNWLINYIKDRGNVTKYAGKTSGMAFIDASVIQDSVLGKSHSTQEHLTCTRFTTGTYIYNTNRMHTSSLLQINYVPPRKSLSVSSNV